MSVITIRDQSNLVSVDDAHQLVAAMLRVMTPEHVDDWLRSPNLSLDSRTPIAVIVAGEIDRVLAMLFEIGEGIPS